MENSEITATLFKNPPESGWSLRGDPFLWDELNKVFLDRAKSCSVSELELDLVLLFEELTCHSLGESEAFHVARFSKGGMSSGFVDPNHWRTALMPELAKRFALLQKRGVPIKEVAVSNARKISKAIYLLVEKYHRLHGLEVYGFSGGHGPGYAGFQVAAHRCWAKGRPHANYEAPFGDGRQVLVTYLTNVGIPAWCSGDQLELPDWEHQRTSTIVSWLERHLSLLELFDLYKSEIASWRARYTVEESEKYLLMINLAGLISARLGDIPRTPEQLYHSMDPTGMEKAEQIVSRLGVADGNIDAFGIDGCMVGRNGLALVEEEVVDVWAIRLSGKSCGTLADDLWNARSMIPSD